MFRPSSDAFARSIDDIRLRLVEFQIALQKDELSALQRRRQQGLADRIELREIVGRFDDEINRQALEPGSGGNWKAATCWPASPDSRSFCIIVCSVLADRLR